MDDTIDTLLAASETLNAELLGYDPDDAQAAVTALHRLRAARQTMQVCEGIIEAAVAPLLGRDPVEIPGVGVALARKGKARTAWDHDALLAVVLDVHLAEKAGEMPTPWEVREWITSAAALSYWRKGALAPLGIDPDEYCETKPGRTTVQITANVKPETAA